jgi:hypothetical protein
MRVITFAILSVLSAPVLAPGAGAGGEQDREAICLMVESAARANGLPLDFFARVIWQESRFDADAIGPRTRGGQHAQGIAQFMPGTAAERQLLDPFDPVEALPKAAAFLRDLRAGFGNLGLAAAAYNAGPHRVRAWLDGAGGMPAQTRHYVWAITGHTVDDWKGATDGSHTTKSESSKSENCATLMARLESAPNAFVAALARRVEQGAAHPWGVQLAASFSRTDALSAYARTMHRLDAVLTGRDPLILHHLMRSRGTRPIYQIRVGADSRRAADRLCGRIRAAGGACLVLRNG